MTSTANNIDAPKTFDGYPVNYYAERLSDFQIEYMLPTLAKFCLAGNEPSTLLAAYIGACQSFEKMRRDAIADGAEIIEAVLPLVPAHYWSGPELAKALGKVVGLVTSTHGEVNMFVHHVLGCILAETQFRLGLRNQ